MLFGWLNHWVTFWLEYVFVNIDGVAVPEISRREWARAWAEGVLGRSNGGVMLLSTERLTFMQIVKVLIHCLTRGSNLDRNGLLVGLGWKRLFLAKEVPVKNLHFWINMCVFDKCWALHFRRLHLESPKLTWGIASGGISFVYHFFTVLVF